MNLILFILGVIGMTHIIVDSVLLEPFHKWTKQHSQRLAAMTDCHQCSGFWCGTLLAPVLLSYNPLVWFAAGCAGSFLAQLGYWTLDALEHYAKRQA